MGLQAKPLQSRAEIYFGVAHWHSLVLALLAREMISDPPVLGSPWECTCLPSSGVQTSRRGGVGVRETARNTRGMRSLNAAPGVHTLETTSVMHKHLLPPLGPFSLENAGR